MPFMMKLTALGAAKVAAAQAGGAAVTLTEFAVGDGNGAPVPVPTGVETDLANEVWRGDISSLAVKAGAPTVVVAEALIPSDEGGWAVRELGIFDDDGDLFAYGNLPETWKPVAGDGATREMLINAELRVGSAANVTLVIDPALVTATRAWCLSTFLRIDQNLADVADPDEARENIGAAKVSDVDPAALAGAPLPGVSDEAARADHRHQVPEISDIPGLTAALNGLVVTPIGGILPLAGAQDPRWLRCNGAAYLQSAYPALYGQVGLLPRFTWTKRSLPAGSMASIGGLRYLNSNFVTLGTGANTSGFYSNNNGVSWAGVTANLSANWRDMCWTGAKYVAAGASNGISNSAAIGAAFTARASAFAAGTDIYCVASDGAGTVVSVANSGSLIKAQRSTDHGDTWALTAALPSAGNWTIQSMVYAAGRWVFSATDNINSLTYIYTSVDGANWTLAASAIAGQLSFVTYFGGAFYAIGPRVHGYADVMKSTNGTAWTLLGGPAYPMGTTSNFAGMDCNRAVALPNGLLSFNAPINTPSPANYFYGDLRYVMQLAPPGQNLQVAGAIYLAFSGSLIMLFHSASTELCYTAPIYDYSTGTEFIVPDIGPTTGTNAAPFYIRAT